MSQPLNIGNNIAALAQSLENPTAYGANAHGPAKFDTPGLITWSYLAAAGIWVEPSVAAQAVAGAKITLWDDCRPGDIIVLGTPGTPTATAIYLDDATVVIADSSGVHFATDPAPSYFLFGRRLFPWTQNEDEPSSGVPDAVFSGTMEAIVAATPGTTASSGVSRVYDGNTGTSWYTTGANPANLWAYFDLGANVELQGIRWRFKEDLGSGDFNLAISDDAITWHDRGTFRREDIGRWYGAGLLGSKSRYVRIFHDNPGLYFDALGYLSEIEIYSNPVVSLLPTGTANPWFSGSKLAVSSSSGSANGSGSGRVWDGNAGTSWYSTDLDPTHGFFNLNLGSIKAVSGIKWKVNASDGAEDVIIETSADNVGWTQAARVTAGTTGTWYGVTLSTSAKYVRFLLANPNRRFVIGYISEVEIWGS